MTKIFHIDFHGTRFTVPKLSLFNLFEHQRDLFDATDYKVQSSVPLGLFEIFVAALVTATKVPVTKENAGAISLLAKEFWLEDLLSECLDLQMASTPELITALSERISKLEDQMSSRPLALVAELKESIAHHERQLESLDCRISGLERNLTTHIKALKSGSRASVSTPTPLPHVAPVKSPTEVKFPLQEAKSTDGIISYLTRKFGGNVHDIGIVTLTSTSVYDDDPRHALRNVADLTSDAIFWSKNEPGQWVCWDFHEMRLRPAHYTIAATFLNSWVVDGSLDGVTWTEIDRKTGPGFNSRWETASFAVSKPAECRFIRLTGKHDRTDSLFIRVFEVFGTLLE